MSMVVLGVNIEELFNFEIEQDFFCSCRTIDGVPSHCMSGCTPRRSRRRKAPRDRRLLASGAALVTG